MSVSIRRLLLPALAGLFLAACSLAGDVTPPPEARPLVAQPAAPTLAPQDSAPAAAATAEPISLAPATRPSAAAGAAIFQQSCAPCHGATGNADGEMSANVPGGSDVIPKFSQPDWARPASPLDWYTVVTEGRLDKFMPPFNEKLSNAQRWNVVAYVYTLSTPPEQIAAGQEVYDASCARCHGAAGQGDGPEAANLDLRDFTDFVGAAAVSPADLFDAVTTGAGTPGHDFQAKLSDDERWAVVGYVRAFAYDYFAPGAPLPVQAGTVTGRVTNGTSGAPVAASVEVNLLAFDEQSGVLETLTGTVDAAGQYQFADVAYQGGRQFVAAATYQDITYHSPVMSFADGQDTLEIPVTVYDTTDQPDGVRINRVHTFLIFEVPGFVTVGQLYILSNVNSRTFAPADGRTVEFGLPAGATALEVQDGEEGSTFFRTEAGFVDTVPVLPGEGAAQILFSFRLPYENALSFQQKMFYPVEAVNVMLSDQGVALTGDGYVAGEAQDMGGQGFLNYSRPGLEAGQDLVFQLGGESAVDTAAAQPAAVTANDPLSLAVGLGALALALIGIGVWWWRQAPGGAARPAPAKAAARRQEREDLLQALAELDDEYAAGRVSEAEYQKERAWLKQELLKVWEPGR